MKPLCYALAGALIGLGLTLGGYHVSEGLRALGSETQREAFDRVDESFLEMQERREKEREI